MIIATAFSASAMAVISSPTQKVVGFKPVYTQHNSAVIGKIELGQTLTLDPSLLGYYDRDGDLEDNGSRTINWIIDGNIEGTGLSYTIPKDNDYVGKPITLVITPKALAGDPKEGVPYTITNLQTAGASGGNASGGITTDNTAAPIVTALTITGTLQVGQNITANYTFDANGGEPTDKSLYAWGQTGTTAAAAPSGSAITTSGQVPAYTLQPSDAGSIMEVSVQPKNNANVTGTVVTADSTAMAGYPGGKVELAPAENPISVAINFTSSATLDDNGVDGGRPVAAVDLMTAVLTTQPGTESAVSNYTFQWKADGVNIGLAVDGIATFTPSAAEQGKVITVDVVKK